MLVAVLEMLLHPLLSLLLYLFLQVRLAGGDLFWQRIAVVRWTALQHVADVDIVATQLHGLDDLRQQLPRLADKRQPLPILVGARGFPNKHDAGIGGTGPKNETLPRLP